MRWIGLVVALALSLVLVPLAVEAQQAAHIPRVRLSLAHFSSDPRTARWLQAFSQGLREVGYVEGQNIAIESRFERGAPGEAWR